MIPKRNYIFFCIIVLLVILTTIFAALIYKRNEVKEFSYIYDKISELNSKDLFNYLLETPDCIIYMSDKYNLNNNIFERNFVNTMQKENILDYVVFLDYNTLNKKTKKEFKEKFSYDLDNYSFPIIITYVDGEVTSIKTISEVNNDFSNSVDFEALK